MSPEDRLGYAVMAHRFISANRHRVKTEHIKNLFSAAAHRRAEP